MFLVKIRLMHGCESTIPYHHYYQHHRHVLERRDEDFAENQLSRAVEQPTSGVVKVDLKKKFTSLFQLSLTLSCNIS